jgi:hypothetical protein
MSNIVDLRVPRSYVSCKGAVFEAVAGNLRILNSYECFTSTGGVP